MSKYDATTPAALPVRSTEQQRVPTVAAEQLREHYSQIPVMAIAPTLGMVYTAWVLWQAAPRQWLVAGVASISVLSSVRLLLYRRFFAAPWPRPSITVWARLAVLASLLSGCLWGSAAPLLYPAANHGEYDTYLLVLLTLVPIVPVAALAAYMPAFYAYYFPCMAPFIVTLALQPGRAERLTALLLVMMMLAMLTFAQRYASSLAESIRLRLVLADKSAALEASVRQKTQLIAAASHDLRQPVHAMGLFLETLRHRHGDVTEQSRVLGYLHAGVRSLRGMLSNMLDISRLDSEIVAARLSAVPLHELLHRLTDEYAVLALDRGLVLRCRATDAWVLTDPVLIERILRNLLSNALKFTRQGGVVLACRVRSGVVWLQVFDTGIGIAAEDADRVFEPFVQLPGSERADGAGLGLGLAIVRRLAALLDHPLRMQSRAGRGTRFTLVLPRAAFGETASSTKGMGQEASLGDMPPGLVMLIDDDEAVAAGAAALLQLWGHQVLVSTSEAQALLQLAAAPRAPDLLLADLRLGDTGSGLHAVRQVRQQLGWPVPAVLVTADTAPTPIREAVTAGHLLLHKPVDPVRLRGALAEAWAAAVSLRPPQGDATGVPLPGDASSR